MIINMMMPFFILLSIVGLIFILLKWLRGGKRQYLYGKRVHWMLGSYIIILLISVGLNYLIPKQEPVSGEHIIQENIPNLADLVYEGKSLDNAHMYMKDQWEFEYEKDQLQIVGHGESDFSNVLISVVRKSENDGIVEAAYYQTPIVIYGIDITEYTKPLRVELPYETLNIITPELIEVRFNIFENEFPIRQFTGEVSWLDRDGESRFNTHVLHLRIPKDMEIINADEYFDVHYVKE